LVLGEGIRKWVTLSHAAIIGGVLVVGVIQSWLRPKLVITPIRMIEMPTAKVLSTQTTAETSNNTSTAPTPVKSIKQPETQVTRNPERKLRTVDEIRQAALRPATSSRTPQTTSTQAQTSMPNLDVKGISERLKNTAAKVNITVGSTGKNSFTTNTSNNAAGKYPGAIRAALYQKWNQPSASLVPEPDRSVTVRLVIAADGRIIKASIINPSRNALMNQSILEIFKNTQKLPAPASYGLGDNRFTATIAFQLN